MTLAAGTRLGPYEILSPIAAGGMGEVYQARDSRLGRTVAVKVLPERMAADPNRRLRFEREAKAISQFNHPHVCTLFDVGCQGDIDFLVMEFLEGETLAARLARGSSRAPVTGAGATSTRRPGESGASEPTRRGSPLPLDETLRIGAELAEALAAAHKAGIIHRDLKPGHVMLTRNGVKVLDFGLAKLRETGGSADAATLATRTIGPATEAGVTLGTLPYMAPEQVEGKETDARSDLFAFGTILYEMLTGRRAFEGETAASVAAAILDREPTPVIALEPLTPPAFVHVVTTCLAKDPEARWQAASDVARHLRWIATELRRAHMSPVAPIETQRDGPRALIPQGDGPETYARQPVDPASGEPSRQETRTQPRGALLVLIAHSRLTMTGGISYFVFKRSDEVVNVVSDIARYFPRGAEEEFHINQGGGEITVVCDADHEHLVAGMRHQAVDYRHPVGVLRVRETGDESLPRGVDVPGLYAYFMGVLADEGVNVLDVISAGREMALVLAEKDLTVAFTLLTERIKECRRSSGI